MLRTFLDKPVLSLRAVCRLASRVSPGKPKQVAQRVGRRALTELASATV
jgi:hypothetical protein